MAGVGAGKWQRCRRDDGFEESEGISVPDGHRTSTCGHARPKLEQAPPSEEGRPPGDVARLAAARFIRYMHSYSLPPREVSHSCEHCREAKGATQASEGFGRQGRRSGTGHAPPKQITVTIRKRDEEKPGHPLLSQLLSSKPRPARYRAHLHPSTIGTLTTTLSKSNKGKRSKSPALAVSKVEVHHLSKTSSGSRNEPPPRQDEEADSGTLLSALGIESWVSQSESGLDMGFGLELGWLNHRDLYQDDNDDDDGVAVDDDHLMGRSAAVLSQSPPSPLFPDTRIAEPTPARIIHGQGHPHRQTLSEHPDDQAHLLLGNQDCIPPTSLISALCSPSPNLTFSSLTSRLTPYSNANLTIILRCLNNSHNKQPESQSFLLFPEALF